SMLRFPSAPWALLLSAAALAGCAADGLPPGGPVASELALSSKADGAAAEPLVFESVLTFADEGLRIRAQTRYDLALGRDATAVYANRGRGTSGEGGGPGTEYFTCSTNVRLDLG